jgi:hypothetical protein
MPSERETFFRDVRREEIVSRINCLRVWLGAGITAGITARLNVGAVHRRGPRKFRPGPSPCRRNRTPLNGV